MTVPAWLRNRLDELRLAMMILTRLPAGHAPLQPGTTFARALWAYPIAGALVGALYATTLGRVSWTAFLGACGALGGLELLLAFQETVVGYAVMLAGIGAAFSCFTSNASATLRFRMPEPLRARILSLYSYSWMGAAPLGGLLAGCLGRRTVLPLLQRCAGPARRGRFFRRGRRRLSGGSSRR